MNRQAASRPGTRLPDDMVPGDKHAPASGPVDSVLSVRDLHVEFAAETGLVKAVRGLSFDVCAGESLAIVGESGAGKSATSLAIMGLHPATASFRGSIKLHGQELLGRDDGAMSRLRGQTVSMIFQDPLSALTPVYTVGDQIIEAIRVHHSMDRRVAMRRAVELLDLVGIPEPHRRVQAYPHEFSGGMRQRAMIAMAIANDPDVIIADEPTTALDVTIQAQVLEVLKKARDETHAALILVTHDLGVVAGVADRVSVMYAGRVVEQGSVREIFHQPCMPYTIGLLGSIPRPDGRTRKALTTIEGSPPSMIELPRGCPFAPRCPLLKVDCLDTEPKLSPTHSVSHRAACIQGHAIATGKLHRHDVYQSGFAVDCAAPVYGPGQTSQDIPWENAAEGLLRRDQREIVLKLADMAQHYPLLEGAIFRRRVGTVFAVDGIDLMLRQGETLGLVGESGCGKSTTVRAIMELQPPTHGSISVLGRDVAQLRSRAERREMRRDLQVVFQDPMASLDPRLPVFDLIAEPLGVFGISGAPLAHRVDELLALVGLDASLLDRYPSQLSGGQRQRVCIARSLALEPKLLILDEPVSALDVSIRAGVINLLDSLRATLGLSYLLVAHDLAIVRHIADRVAVMYLGTIVETGDVEAVYEHPAHPYTSALLSAMPIPDPDAERDRRRILLEGELPSPTNPPSGCRFHTRCPKKLTLTDEEQRRCVNEAPELRQVGAVKSNTVSNAEAASHVQLAPEPNTLHTSACHYNDRLLAVSN